MSRAYIGFDPGGVGAFGWCVLFDADNGQVVSGVCSTATDALSAAVHAASIDPLAIGIDAPMFWTSNGDRVADRLVRRSVLRFGGNSGTVSAVNSLRGACIAQGIIIARLARARWPRCPITEAHPKALLRISERAAQFAKRLDLPGEHQRDAALGAYAAWALHTRALGWQDLRQQEADLHDLVPEPAPVYWFPLSDA